MARAAAEGHRVVLVVATGGEFGESPLDLADGETLADRRAAETDRSAAALNIAKVYRLGFRDSGMTGWAQNADPAAFMNIPTEVAAQALADILQAEDASVVTIYDWHGNYGHPDHIAVHRVGRRAAELAGVPHVYEATMNRDRVMQFAEAARAGGLEVEFDPNDTDDGNPFGMPEADLTTAIDVTAYVAAKRSSMTCHASQITDSSFFLQMPPEAFASAFRNRVVHPGGSARGNHGVVARRPGVRRRRRRRGSGRPRCRIGSGGIMILSVEELSGLVRDVADFPKPGVLFRDITPVLAHPQGLASMVEHLSAPWRNSGVTLVAGVEARGFLLAPMVAAALGVGMIPIRKPGKLPWHSTRKEYALEYGTDALEMHIDAVGPNDRVLIIDDVLATGGTAAAAIGLVQECGGLVAGAAFVIELGFLAGREALADTVVTSVLCY